MENKIVLGNDFYAGNSFFYFLLFIYFMKHTRYFLCFKIDHAPLIILKFIFETFKSYFLNSLILLLKLSWLSQLLK